MEAAKNYLVFAVLTECGSCYDWSRHDWDTESEWKDPFEKNREMLVYQGETCTITIGGGPNPWSVVSAADGSEVAAQAVKIEYMMPECNVASSRNLISILRSLL